MRFHGHPLPQAVRHLVGLGLCWTLLIGGTVASARVRPVVRPLYCEYIKKLGTDLLNDSTNIPTAWQRLDGAIHYDRLGQFHVYALTNELRFWKNVTSERRYIRIRPHHLPGDAAPLGKVYFADGGIGPRFCYKPPGQRRAERPVLLSFEYRCTAPAVVYRRYFLLDVRNTPAPIEADWAQIPPVDDVERFPDLIPDCPDFERLGIDYLADDREGIEARDTRSGTFSRGREAAFRLYGLGTDASRDLDLTRRDSRLRITLWTPPGSRPATGTFRFEGYGSNSRIVYTPQFSGSAQAAVITFSYRCGFHVHRRDFLLESIYGAPATPAGEVAPNQSCSGGG